MPDAGRAWVAGHDVVREPAAVQRSIGVTAQDATVDGLLTGRQNLVMIGQLSGLRRSDAKRRATELLEQFDLTDAADRVLTGYSGGMRRRLDLAAGLVTRPPGALPRRAHHRPRPDQPRPDVGRHPRPGRPAGVTLLLTTQYLDEADELADRIVVIDHGRVIADGTSGELKAGTGGARLEVTLSEPAAGGGRRPGPLRVRRRPREPRRTSAAGARPQRLGPGHHRGAGARRAPASPSTTSRCTSRPSTTCSSPSPVTRSEPDADDDRRRARTRRPAVGVGA